MTATLAPARSTDRPVARVAALLRPRRGPARVAAAAAGLLLLLAVVHLGVQVVDGGDWWAVASWRKPVSFSIALATTLLVAGWTLDRLPHRPLLAWSVTTGAVATAFVEVGAVTLQQWRGVPSHFNVAAPFDAAVLSAMGVAVILLTLVLTVLAGWAWRSLRHDAATRWAAAGGLALLLAAAGGIGNEMIARGNAAVAATGTVPTTLVGGAGSTKLAHAVGIHAVGALVLLVVVLEAWGFGAAVRHRVLRAATLAASLLTAGVAVQAYAGRAVLDPTPTSALLLVGALLLVARAVAAGRSGVRAA